ncbi:DUF7024 domain-containing protein [Pseudomonas putida]|uniref:DUF7024 domain-containing protein n=1 Tax=Pseudomonas putida TaxID=303 RepID=UPI003D988D1F
MGIKTEREPVATPDEHGQGLLRQAKSDWKWLALGAIFSFEFASVLLMGWPGGLIPSINLPYVFAGDALLSQWTGKRAIEGWFFENPRNGFPFGSELYDYPNSDSGSLLIYKLLGNLTHSFFSAVDLYFLLSFPVIFSVAFVVIRSFGVRKTYSAMAAVLFAFMPFHMSRLLYGHDLYTWYFSIPLFFYYGKSLFLHGKTHWGLHRPSRLLAFVLVIAALSSFGVYYAFFGVIVLMVSGIAGAARIGRIRPAVNALLVCGAIVLGLLANMLPNVIYRAEHGINPEVAARVPIESEVYALKLVHLLLPQPQHRVTAMGTFTTNYNVTFPLANTTAGLGIVGSVGFLAALLAVCAALIGRKVEPRIAMVSLVVLALLLASAVGGFNVVFAMFISPMIRAWDRASIFIAFGSILTFALLLNGCSRINRSALVGTLFAMAIAVFGLLDQTPTSYASTVAIGRANAAMDQQFIQQLESSLPPGSAIYQLPYIAFPESAPMAQMSAYQPLTGFINSDTLRWSSGGMQGREGDLYYRALSKKSISDQITAIKQLGFVGVYVDRRGFTDHGAAIVDDLTAAFGAGPTFERADGLVVFFKIPG